MTELERSTYEADKALIESTFGFYRDMARAATGFVEGYERILETQAWLSQGHRDFTALWIAHDMGKYKAPMSIRREIVQRIRLERSNATQVDIAIWVGVSEGTVSRDLHPKEPEILQMQDEENPIVPSTSENTEEVYTTDNIFVESFIPVGEEIDETDTSIIEPELDYFPDDGIAEPNPPIATSTPPPAPPKPKRPASTRLADNFDTASDSIRNVADHIDDNGSLASFDAQRFLETSLAIRADLDKIEKFCRSTRSAVGGPTPNNRAYEIANWYLREHDDTQKLHALRNLLLPFIKSNKSYTDDEIKKALASNKGTSPSEKSLRYLLNVNRGEVKPYNTNNEKPSNVYSAGLLKGK